FILKRELQWIPLFGWFTIKGRMIPVNRDAGKAGLIAMNELASKELASGRQIVIFPEGTRRPAGAEPRYKYGIMHLYQAAGVPCLPIALNSGLFWRRRSILKQPGTVIVEVLDPIPPGLDGEAFMTRLQHDLEAATNRLIEEGRRDLASRLR
ncbi:MAG TPA: lysophospholipid acyltransferase family protein, partial [Burkholderiales bacterium]|nr:lysophospholipid acyltransferase family protein [Burkholderiales bacterium]